MEWWNGGILILKGSNSFIKIIVLPVKRNDHNNPLSQFPRTHYSSIPTFQHSNCERSELSIRVVTNRILKRHSKGQYGSSAIISNLGLMDTEKLSGGGFYVSSQKVRVTLKNQ